MIKNFKRAYTGGFILYWFLYYDNKTCSNTMGTMSTFLILMVCQFGYEIVYTKVTVASTFLVCKGPKLNLSDSKLWLYPLSR